VTAELNTLKAVSTKTIQRGLHKSNTNPGKAATAKPLITENNAQMRKGWCHDHKTWKSDNWKQAHDTVR
jgi:hypothetical protein